MAASIQTIGGADLQRRLGNILLGLRTAEANAGFRKGAGVIRDEARQQAPKKSGKLAAAIISFASKKSGGRNGEPAGWARVNLFKGRVTARHGFWVEFGTKERRSKRAGKRLKFVGDAGLIFPRKVGAMRPNPFFERAVTVAGGRALDTTVQALVDVFNKAAK